MNPLLDMAQATVKAWRKQGADLADCCELAAIVFVSLAMVRLEKTPDKVPAFETDLDALWNKYVASPYDPQEASGDEWTIVS